MGYLKDSDFNKVLPKETAEKFRVVGLSKRNSYRISFFSFGTVDFRTLSLPLAERLERNKFPHLERIQHENVEKKEKASKTSKTQESSD